MLAKIGQHLGTAPAEARRAQVLAVAADVFARTAITPEALAEIARMSKARSSVETAPGPLLETTRYRQAWRLARRRVSELLTGARGTLRDCDADELESRIEVLFALFSGMRIRALMNPALKRDALIAAVRRVVRMVLTPGS